jgi:uncharacterized DUF497 family protein
VKDLRVDDLRILSHIENRLWAKHHVTFEECWQVVTNDDPTPKVRRSDTGDPALHRVCGRTNGDRMLLVVLAEDNDVPNVYWTATARDADDKERRASFGAQQR